ncbi:MAG: hypothetical protein R3A10_09540 [Caldilineaceae bacterium]
MITTLFTAVIGPDGQFVKAQDVVHWSGSFTQLDDPGFTDFVMRQTDAASSGWPTFRWGLTSSFAPEQGERGPWCWMPFAAAAWCGGGLPDNLNVSHSWSGRRWNAQLSKAAPPAATASSR